jgi:hypothetical protein
MTCDPISRPDETLSHDSGPDEKLLLMIDRSQNSLRGRKKIRISSETMVAKTHCTLDIPSMTIVPFYLIVPRALFQSRKSMNPNDDCPIFLWAD